MKQQRGVGKAERPTSFRPMWPDSVIMRMSQARDMQQPPAGQAPRMAARDTSGVRSSCAMKVVWRERGGEHIEFMWRVFPRPPFLHRGALAHHATLAQHDQQQLQDALQAAVLKHVAPCTLRLASDGNFIRDDKKRPHLSDPKVVVPLAAGAGCVQLLHVVAGCEDVALQPGRPDDAAHFWIRFQPLQRLREMYIHGS